MEGTVNNLWGFVRQTRGWRTKPVARQASEVLQGERLRDYRESESCARSRAPEGGWRGWEANVPPPWLCLGPEDLGNLLSYGMELVVTTVHKCPVR